jgi:ABC-type multidrug transport system permease subunit
MGAIRWRVIGEVIRARVLEFFREPEAIFWVYCFPIIMVIVLGLAFREKPVEKNRVDVADGPAAARVRELLAGDERLDPRVSAEPEYRRRLRGAKTDVVVLPAADGNSAVFLFDPTRPESLLARDRVNDALQRGAGRKDPVNVQDTVWKEPGGRYVDFLVPGLIGMGIMGSGLFGVGFSIVDMRIRKLLKRLLATPLSRGEFLASTMLSRLIFVLPEVIVQVGVAWLLFGVSIRGSLPLFVVVVVFGEIMFAGIGLLVASRVKTLEAASGMVNLVALPSWLLSGVFFSTDRFPDAAQWFIRLLPLTSVVNAVRGVMQDGLGPQGIAIDLAIMAGWTILSFIIALRIFRWN